MDYDYQNILKLADKATGHYFGSDYISPTIMSLDKDSADVTKVQQRMQDLADNKEDDKESVYGNNNGNARRKHQSGLAKSVIYICVRLQVVDWLVPHPKGRSQIQDDLPVLNDVAEPVTVKDRVDCLFAFWPQMHAGYAI